MTFFAGKVKATRPLVLTGCPGTLELRHISLPSYAARTVVQLAVHGTLQVTPYTTRIDRGSADAPTASNLGNGRCLQVLCVLQPGVQENATIRVTIDHASRNRAEVRVDGGPVHIAGRWLGHHQSRITKYSAFGRSRPARNGVGDESDESDEAGFMSMMLGSSDDEDEGRDSALAPDSLEVCERAERRASATPRVRRVATDRLPAGSQVRLHGLASRPDLNGTTCEVLHFDADASVMRYAVQLADGSCIRVKPECVAPANPKPKRVGGSSSGARGLTDRHPELARAPTPARAFAAKYSPFATSKVTAKDFRDTNAFKKQSRIARRVPKELQEEAKKGGAKKGVSKKGRR